MSINTVAASMARQGLVARAPKRRRRSLTRPDKAAAPVPDLVGRDFTATGINQKWCGDLTEIPTTEGTLYLAIVEDLASRRLPGFAIGEHHDAELAKAALCMATAIRGGEVAGVIFHSDKGGEYTGDLFATACRALGVRRSMGRVASALDNAAAESCNSTLEFELLSRQVFETKDQARREVAGYIDRYNHRRRHSSTKDAGPRRRRSRPRRPSRRDPRGGMNPASQRPPETPEPTGWHPRADDERLRPTISNPPRFEGKPNALLCCFGRVRR